MALYCQIDKAACIGCGACGSTAPEIFDYDDEGMAENVYGYDNNSGTVEVPEELYGDLEDACSFCPMDSIKVSKQPFN